MWRKLIVGFLCGVPLAGAGLFLAFGLVWNQTPSLPVGLWKKVDVDIGQALQKGMFATFCPTPAAVAILEGDHKILGWGSCESGYRTFLKKVSGVPGDVVSLDEGGVSINGQAIANSRTVFRSRSLYKGPTSFQIPEGFVWMMATDSAASFDSRYFGLVPTSALRAVVKPWITNQQSN